MACPTSSSCRTRSSTAREEATRAAIRKLRPGTFVGESSFDVPGGEIITLKAAVTIDPEAGEIAIDFAGSSPQTSTGINVVLNYTHAYSTFAVRSCLNPELPNNTGSLAPIKVARAARARSSTAAIRRRCNARHVVGMYVPMPILKALYQVMPERVIAEGSGAVWTMQIQGKRRGRRALHLLDVQLFRRHGRARQQAGAERHLLSDRHRRGAGRDPGSGRCRSSSTARNCGRAPAARAHRAAATARSSSSTCRPTIPGCSTRCRAGSTTGPRASAAASRARPGAFW